MVTQYKILCVFRKSCKALFTTIIDFRNILYRFPGIISIKDAINNFSLVRLYDYIFSYDYIKTNRQSQT